MVPFFSSSPNFEWLKISNCYTVIKKCTDENEYRRHLMKSTPRRWKSYLSLFWRHHIAGFHWRTSNTFCRFQTWNLTWALFERLHRDKYKGRKEILNAKVCLSLSDLLVRPLWLRNSLPVNKLRHWNDVPSCNASTVSFSSLRKTQRWRRSYLHSIIN